MLSFSAESFVFQFAWSVTLKEKYGLRVLKDRVLRKMLRSKMEG